MRPPTPAARDTFDDGAITVRWRIGAERAAIALLWTIDLGQRNATASLHEPGAEARAIAGPIAVRVSPEGAALHIDADGGDGEASPLLAVSIRTDGDGPRLLFARTSLLRSLRIEGGRYEPVGMERSAVAAPVRSGGRRPARRDGAWAHSAAR